MTKRVKMPTDRSGLTHKIQVGKVTLYVTLNLDAEGKVREVFCKSDEGHQAESDGLAGLVSIALQGGPYAEVLDRVVKFLRFRRYPPHGGPGQAISISDAIGRVIEATKENGNG